MNVKDTYIHAIYEQKAFLIKEEPFQLHHGGTSHLYLNHSTFLSDYQNLDMLTDVYKTLIPSECVEYSLGAVDSVLSPVLVGMLAQKLKKDVVSVKEKKLEHGLENKVYGAPKAEVVLVDDVTSTGTILINAAEALRANGTQVRFAIISACRDLSAVENLQKHNIQVLYVATYEEIVHTLWGTLSDAEKEAVRKEVIDKKYNWKLPQKVLC